MTEVWIHRIDIFIGIIFGAGFGFMSGYLRAYADLWLSYHGVKTFKEYRERERMRRV